MINAVGRDIPEEILKATGKEVFHGSLSLPYLQRNPLHGNGDGS